MMIFQFKDTDAALDFWRRVKERHADTLTERHAILLEMAREGLMERVVQTKRTREQVVKDMAQHYRVLDVRAKGKDDEESAS